MTYNLSLFCEALILIWKYFLLLSAMYQNFSFATKLHICKSVHALYWSLQFNNFNKELCLYLKIHNIKRSHFSFSQTVSIALLYLSTAFRKSSMPMWWNNFLVWQEHSDILYNVRTFTCRCIFIKDWQKKLENCGITPQKSKGDISLYQSHHQWMIYKCIESACKFINW
jgi:hypothetical protein